MEHALEVLTGGFDELSDICFQHFLFLLIGFLLIHGSHSRAGQVGRLLRQRGDEVTAIDL